LLCDEGIAAFGQCEMVFIAFAHSQGAGYGDHMTGRQGFLDLLTHLPITVIAIIGFAKTSIDARTSTGARYYGSMQIALT